LSEQIDIRGETFMSEGQSRLKRKLEKAGALVSVNKAGVVKAVQFVGKRTKDKHMELLAEATELEKLIVSYSSITDAGLAYLSNLTKLRILSLFRNDITNHGISYLAGLSNLEQLNVEETGFSDEGMPTLCKLTSLARVSMDHERVSQKAEDMLKKAVPDCQIYR
jgi:hypothetical protein